MFVLWLVPVHEQCRSGTIWSGIWCLTFKKHVSYVHIIVVCMNLYKCTSNVQTYTHTSTHTWYISYKFCKHFATQLWLIFFSFWTACIVRFCFTLLEVCATAIYNDEGIFISLVFARHSEKSVTRCLYNNEQFYFYNKIIFYTFVHVIFSLDEVFCIFMWFLSVIL